MKTAPEGLKGWSTAAAAVAEYLTRNSCNGVAMDPQARVPAVAAVTGLSGEDVRLGVLDLHDAGLVEWSREARTDRFWPRTGLFVEFDRHYLGFDTPADAIAIASRVVSEGFESVTLDDRFADLFPGWTVRRLNSALGFLEEGRLIEVVRTLGQRPWLAHEVRLTDRTRRFLRDHG